MSCIWTLKTVHVMTTLILINLCPCTKNIQQMKQAGLSSVWKYIHYTPKRGSWFDIAEMELNVVTRQCLARRIKNIVMFREELAVWEIERNTIVAKCFSGRIKITKDIVHQTFSQWYYLHYIFFVHQVKSTLHLYC